MPDLHAVWGVGALLIGLVIPVTLIVIFPTNKRLLEAGAISARRKRPRS